MVVLLLSCVILGMAAGIDGARLMKVARLRTENGNGTALKDLEKLLEEAKGSKRKDQEVRFGGQYFWQLEMVEADRAKVDS